MSKIIECIPNISEGRDVRAVLACVEAVASVDGITVMNHTSDASHNRSVITFMGSPEAVGEAAVRLAVAAAKNIDLRQHDGVHPRVGALDVLPFVPIHETSVEEAVELSRKVGERIWREAGIPVYLYEDSATAPHRKNLADVRRGQFEGLGEKTKLPEWKPDFGEGFHPSAGVTVAGARFPLIAYNFDLDTEDVGIAKAIAKQIRQSSGGMTAVKALGVYLEERHCAQVTVNLVNYKITPLWKLTEEVRRLARELGTQVRQAELIGLMPMEAVADAAKYYLGLTDFEPNKRIIESFLIQ